MKVRQNVTYHCKNSEAKHMKLKSADGIDMHTGAHMKNQPKILFDGCKVRSLLFLIFIGLLALFFYVLVIAIIDFTSDDVMKICC